MRSLRIVVAGAGGNTGSHLLPHLARISEVRRLTLVDPDVYETGNVRVQNIEAKDVGQGKAVAQAAKLRQIRPDLESAARQERIEDVPRGLLQCDLFVSCLDSRLARQHLNEIAWRLDTPWIDCGVLGSQNMVRVSAFAPSDDSPCLECGWNAGKDGDYSLLEQEYLCGATKISGFPSMSSSALGALAASLVAIEVAKFVRGEKADWGASRQLIFDAEHGVAQVTAERRNPWCRFDHRVWRLEPWITNPVTTTVRDALRALGRVQVDGHHFVSEMVCPGCGRRDNAPRLNRPLARCAACNRRMASSGFGALERLEPSCCDEFLRLTLAQVGLQAGDILTSGARHRLLMEAA